MGTVYFYAALWEYIVTSEGIASAICVSIIQCRQGNCIKRSHRKKFRSNEGFVPPSLLRKSVSVNQLPSFSKFRELAKNTRATLCALLLLLLYARAHPLIAAHQPAFNRTPRAEFFLVGFFFTLARAPDSTLLRYCAAKTR